MSILPSLSDTRAVKDPAPSWRWVVRVPNDFIAPGSNISSALPYVIAENITFGLTNIDSDARFGGGIRTNFPRFMTENPLSVTFYETQFYDTIQYFERWKHTVINRDTHNFSVPSTYKKNLYFYAFDYKSNSSPTLSGVYRDCWPTTVGSMQYSYDSSNRIMVQVDLACDKVILETALMGRNK